MTLVTRGIGGTRLLTSFGLGTENDVTGSSGRHGTGHGRHGTGPSRSHQGGSREQTTPQERTPSGQNRTH